MAVVRNLEQLSAFCSACLAKKLMDINWSAASWLKIGGCQFPYFTKSHNKVCTILSFSQKVLVESHTRVIAIAGRNVGLAKLSEHNQLLRSKS